LLKREPLHVVLPGQFGAWSHYQSEVEPNCITIWCAKSARFFVC
jgi:hypothetical protein